MNTTSTYSTNTSGRIRLDRWGVAVLTFALALVGISLAQTAYRVWLPTEGWVYRETDDFETDVTYFEANLLGNPTPLQSGDQLLAVDGVAVDDRGDLAALAIADSWREGQVVPMTVRRQGQVLTLAVALKRWTAAGLITYLRSSIGSLGGMLGVLGLAGISLMVLLRRPQDLAARALLLLAAIILANSISTLIPEGPSTWLSAAGLLAAFCSYWIFGILVGPTLLVLALTFPRPKRPIQRRPWLLLLPYMPFWILVAIFGPLPQIGYGLTGVFFVCALFSVIHSTFTQRDAVSRAQMLWGLGGFMAAIILFLPMFVLIFGALGGVGGDTPAWILNIVELLPEFAFPLFAGSLAIAILRYRLFDIEVIIRRTLVYSTLTLALGLVYLGCVVLLQALVVPLLGSSDIAIVASTLAIAALFFPLRRRIQNLIDRRFFRKKYDAAKVLAAFAAAARDETDLARLTKELQRVVGETVQPEFVGVWLKENPRT
jgi:hypothetical protein